MLIACPILCRVHFCTVSAISLGRLTRAQLSSKAAWPGSSCGEHNYITTHSIHELCSASIVSFLTQDFMWEIPPDGEILSSISVKPFKPRMYETSPLEQWQRASVLCGSPMNHWWDGLKMFGISVTGSKWQPSFCGATNLGPRRVHQS